MPAASKVHNQDIAQAIYTSPEFAFRLLYVEDLLQFFLYSDGVYELVTDDQLYRIIHRFINENHPDVNITKYLIQDIADQIAKLCPLRKKSVTGEYIALKDCVISTTDFKPYPFDESRIALYRVPVAYEQMQTCECARWEQFLKEVLVTRDKVPAPDLVPVVQEMFGFYLLPELDPHATFFLVGNGANGKGVLFSVLTELIGLRYIIAMPTQTLTTDKFSTAALIGKKLNICAEEESKYIRSDKFKALISGDLVMAERKYGAHFSFRPTTKYIFSTNDMPTFEGVNYGLRRRLHIIPFYRDLAPHERDYTLTQQLLAELPGILRWALQGAQRLRKNGYVFSSSVTKLIAMDEFTRNLSSALAFIREHYIVDSTSYITKEELFSEYCAWVKEVGKKQMSRHTFTSDINKNIEGIEDTVRRIGGVPKRCYNLRRMTHDELIQFARDQEGAKEVTDAIDAVSFADEQITLDQYLHEKKS